jgi:hypothetical protein
MSERTPRLSRDQRLFLVLDGAMLVVVRLTMAAG